ncbi:CRAL/TRIO domain protein, partial [Toxoplasma gondii RUB]
GRFSYSFIFRKPLFFSRVFSSGAAAHSLMLQSLFQLLLPVAAFLFLVFLLLPRTPLSFISLLLILLVAGLRLLPFTRTARVRLLRSGWTESSREFGELSAAFIVAQSCSSVPSAHDTPARELPSEVRGGATQAADEASRVSLTSKASRTPRDSFCRVASSLLSLWMAAKRVGFPVAGRVRRTFSRIAKESGLRRRVREMLRRAALSLTAREVDLDVDFLGWEIRRNASDPWSRSTVACFVSFRRLQSDPLAAACLPPPRKSQRQRLSSSVSASASPPSASPRFTGGSYAAALGQQAASSPDSVPSLLLSILLLLGSTGRGREKAACAPGKRDLLLCSLLAAGFFEHLDWIRNVATLAKTRSENLYAEACDTSTEFSASTHAQPSVSLSPATCCRRSQVSNRSGETLLASLSSPSASPSSSPGTERGGWDDTVEVAAALNAAQHSRVEALMFAGPDELSVHQRDALHILLRRYAAYGVFHRDVLLFLHVANWKVQVADALIFQLLSWKSAACIDCLEARHVHKELSKCWGYVYSHDRLGRPCLVLRLGNLSLTSSSSPSSPSALSSSASPAGSSGESDWKLAFVFLVEEALKSMGRDVEQLVVLLDARNVSFKNFPVPEILQMQVILQAFYPERLGIVLVVNANWQAKLLWLSLRAQLSGSTRSKIFFLPSEPKKLREFLLTFFEESRLPKWCLQCFS